MAERGIGLVFGGSELGMMGAVAKGVLDAGGEVIGVIPGALARREVAYQNLPDLRVVGTMHERKALMEELSDAFVALPGGLGTLDELFEILTWAQLGIHTKPCGILNVDGFFDPLLQYLDATVGERFIRPEHRDMIQLATGVEEVLDLLSNYEPPTTLKWVDGPLP